MKGIGFFILITLFVFGKLSAQQFEIYNGDTINRRNAAKQRVGHWILFDKQKRKKSEGTYKANRKEGLWISYFSDGKRKAEITFKLGRKRGLAKTYYPNGKVSEEGYWDANKWTGNYKAYHENGKVAYDWNYNKNGKKVGEQKYYFPNGKVMIKGNWDGGKIKGKLVEYYSDGGVKAERTFVNGRVDHKQTKFYEPPKPDIAKKDSLLIKTLPPGNQDKTDSTEKQVTSYFTGEGFHKLFKDSLLSREGEFRGGKLYNGKHYVYDEQGNLIQTRIYKEGKIVEVKNKAE